MRQLVSIVISILLLGASLPAEAKMPPFDMVVRTSGDTVQVIVTIVDDDSVIGGFDPPDLNGLVAVVPADQVDEAGRPLLVSGIDEKDVPLSRIEPGTYQGSVTLGPGRWAVVPFPDTMGDIPVPDAYPDTIMVEIGDEAIGLWAALAAIAVATSLVWRRRHP